jgi:hypothetical protein
LLKTVPLRSTGSGIRRSFYNGVKCLREKWMIQRLLILFIIAVAQPSFSSESNCSLPINSSTDALCWAESIYKNTHDSNIFTVHSDTIIDSDSWSVTFSTSSSSIYYIKYIINSKSGALLKDIGVQIEP